MTTGNPEVFVHRSRIAAPAEEVFAWHERPDAFDHLTPPWANVESLEHTGGIQDGARRVLRVKLGPVTRRWVLEHRDYEPGRQFRDVQIEGPLKSWVHTHRFEPDGDNACIMEDRIEYKLPGGMLGRVLGASFVRHELERLFNYRHGIVAQAFGRQGVSK